jgi:predicted pyridoxine 5'-phosphate oxidase superfamily flavin-nucleotide-binding protein
VPVIGLVGSRASGEIPASHRDLVECPPLAALTTVTKDGYPQTSVVWSDSVPVASGHPVFRMDPIPDDRLAEAQGARA